MHWLQLLLAGSCISFMVSREFARKAWLEHRPWLFIAAQAGGLVSMLGIAGYFIFSFL